MEMQVDNVPVQLFVTPCEFSKDLMMETNSLSC